MRRLLLLLLFVVGFFGIPSTVFAVERIERFDATIWMNADASISVREEILYDFGDAERHGIYRDVPVRYDARGGNYNLRISDISAADEQGAPYLLEVSDQGPKKRMRIGDPNTYVSGENVYVISYTVRRAINYFDTHDELYWNVTGNDWPVAIGEASARVLFPHGVLAAQIQFECFAGRVGSSEGCLEKFLIEGGKEEPPSGSPLKEGGDYESNVSLKERGDSVDLQVGGMEFQHQGLAAGEGLTIVVGVPKGVLAPPSLRAELGYTVKDNLLLLLPVLVLIFFFSLWYTRGRDPKGQGAVITQFDAPDGLSPAEAGTIVDENADNFDISAEIIQLAVMGYLRIVRSEEKKLLGKKVEYTLVKLKSEQPPLHLPLQGGENLLKRHQRKLLEGLFEKPEIEPNARGERIEKVKLSKLKHKFYKQFAEIRESVYDSTVAEGYFVRNPDTIRKIYRFLGVIPIFVSFPLFGILGGYAGASILLSGIIVFAFAFIMPKKTKKGALAKEHILGLKTYLSVAEKERLKFHNAPEKNPKLFEKLLPYAMALKVERAWAEQFEGIYTAQPGWYSGPAGAQFNAVVFTNSLGSFTSFAQKNLTMQKAPSGGSGFGGGPFRL